jgi:P pilus assembly chaperone PapD
MRVSPVKVLLVMTLALLPCAGAMAGVVINGTRVIYPAQAREVTVQVSNDGQAPSLVQAWIDNGDPEQTPDNSDAPFVLTPPIARVEPGRSQALRLIFTGADLPTDRESLFWLNVLDVAPTPEQSGDEDQNFLQVAFRSRVKVFYRPQGLQGYANEAPAALRWSRIGARLRVDNPTPFHVTLAEIHALSGSVETTIEDKGKMVLPRQSLEFTVPANTDAVRFSSINDYGGRVEHTLRVSSGSGG